MSRYRLALSLMLIALGLCLALAVILGAAPSSSPSVEELRQKVVAFAGGPGVLAKVQFLSFDFVSESDSKARVVHHHAYDREKGLWRYSCTLADFAKTPFWNKAAGDRWVADPKVPKGKDLVAVYHFPRLEGRVYIDGKPQSGDENTRLLQRVNDSVDNDRYWMFLPLLIDNPAVHLDPAPPVEQEGYGRLEGFTAWSGSNKAGNRTLWTLYITPKGELVRSDVSILRNPKPVTVLWGKWKQFGPVKIAQEHPIPGMKRGFFEHIQINKPLKIEPPS